MKQKIAMIFPGQGAQYVGMGRDFYERYPAARAVFEQADALLGYELSKIIFEGPEERLTETRYSQVAIYVVSMAILAVIKDEFPEVVPSSCGGLSLGEYSAVTASGKLSFEACLSLVQARGQYMNDACEATEGTMAAVIGLENDRVEEVVANLGLSDALWVANLNCPKQAVLSGTLEGVKRGSEACQEAGARKVVPLQVHGAFHSGLMAEAEQRLAERLSDAPLKESEVQLVMNASGGLVENVETMRKLLAQQVTHSVRWEACVRALEAQGVDLYLEIGCGKTLTGMNRRIGTKAPTINIDKVEDLERLAESLGKERVVQ